MTFEVDASQLACTNLAREMAVEPARVDVFLGFDSADRAVEGSFEVIGKPRVVPGDHYTMLQPPNLPELARDLRAGLDQADPGGAE